MVVKKVNGKVQIGNTRFAGINREGAYFIYSGQYTWDFKECCDNLDGQSGDINQMFRKELIEWL